MALHEAIAENVLISSFIFVLYSMHVQAKKFNTQERLQL